MNDGCLAADSEHRTDEATKLELERFPCLLAVLCLLEKNPFY